MDNHWSDKQSIMNQEIKTGNIRRGVLYYINVRMHVKSYKNVGLNALTCNFE
jgi:hypothetical protein